MSRRVLRSRGTRVAVLLLSCLITVPIVWTDDYFHLSRAAKGAPDSGCPFSPGTAPCGMNAADEPEEAHACSCLNCLYANMETQRSWLRPPIVPWGMKRLSVFAFHSPFVSEIFHPPKV